MTHSPVQTPAQRRPETPPTLQNGDRLTLAEFKYLYENSPRIRRAELLEGVVHVPSPVHLTHSLAHGMITTLLFTYQSQTPGVVATSEQSVELDDINYVQPDALMWIDGAVTLANGIVVGAPTLVVEVAVSMRSHDLSTKKTIYRRNRVPEYLVLAAHEQAVFWYRREAGQYVEIAPDAAGIYRSVAFPGFWLNAPAFWQRETAAALATLTAGVDSAEHAAFVAALRSTDR